MKNATQIMALIAKIGQSATKTAEAVQEVVDWLDHAALSGHDIRGHVEIWDSLIAACGGSGKKILDAGHLAQYVKSMCYFVPSKDESGRWLSVRSFNLQPGDQPSDWEAKTKQERQTFAALWREERKAEAVASIATRAPWHKWGKESTKDAANKVFDAEIMTNALIDRLIKAQKGKGEKKNLDLVDYLVKARDAWEKDRKQSVSESV